MFSFDLSKYTFDGPSLGSASSAASKYSLCKLPVAAAIDPHPGLIVDDGLFLLGGKGYACHLQDLIDGHWLDLALHGHEVQLAHAEVVPVSLPRPCAPKP